MRKNRSTFPFGGAVAHRRVTQDGADALADQRDLLRRVVAAVVDVEALAEAALVERALEGPEQRLGVVGEEELAVAADAAGVVDERDELGLHLARAVLHVGAKHRVGLPELVGVRLGEGEAPLALDLGVGLEQLVRLDHAPEGVRGDALALEQALLDASTVERRHVVRRRGSLRRTCSMASSTSSGVVLRVLPLSERGLGFTVVMPSFL